jgi:DNA polymerase III subunit gamma/tau
MVMSDEALSEKYRPRGFEDFWGQAFPVKFLSGLIRRGQKTRDILLHGAFGSGKTSLAYVFARALNCFHPTDTGSPCGGCDACARPVGASGLREYDVSGSGGSKDDVLGWLEPLLHRPTNYKHQVIFFDEAHALERAASDALLKIIEDRPPWLVFIFATTEPGSLRKALISRLYHLEVRPLAPTTAIAFLEKVAAQEGIDAETEALALLAGIKQGHVRDLLIGLDQVHGQYDVVTLDRVRSAFDVDFIDVLLRYFLALAEGDQPRQVDIFLGWRELVHDRVQWVQAFATTLFYREICRLNVVTDALTASIPESERRRIIEAFCRRLDVNSAEGLSEPWRAMLEFLGQLPGGSDEATLHLWIALFHDFINNEMPALAGGRAQQRPHRCYDEPESPRDMPTVNKIVEHPAEIRSEAPTAAVEHDTFISAADARSIINSASFLIQEHGVYFNVSFELRTALFGRRDQGPSIQLIKQFEQELEEQVTRWSPGAVFARLSFYELHDGDYRGLIVARLPSSTEEGDGFGCLKEAEVWAGQWRCDERLHPSSEAIQMKRARPGSAERAFHWRETLNLCAGLSDAEVGPGQQGEEQPLLQLLRIRQPRWQRVGSLVLPAGQRPFTASTVLQPEAIEQASRYNMKPLSAFDDKAWDQLRQGWELDEYKDRQEVGGQRRRESEKPGQVHGVQRDTWSDDPHDRPRSWRVWW